MTKKTLERIVWCKSAIADLEKGLNGQPFHWGKHTRESKMYVLSRLGFVLVSKSKLEKGGHELKRNAKPVGNAYYGSPINIYADLYLLDVQTRRTLKWYDLWDKGKALCEDGSYGKQSLKQTGQD